MEQKCHSQIKTHEDKASTERIARRENERSIQGLRMQYVEEEVFLKILDKSIY